MFSNWFAYHNCNVESSKRFTGYVSSQRNVSEKIVMIGLRCSVESYTFSNMAKDGTHGTMVFHWSLNL